MAQAGIEMGKDTRRNRQGPMLNVPSSQLPDVTEQNLDIETRTGY